MRGEEVTFYEEVHTPLHTKVKVILDFLYVYMYLFISMQPPGHRRQARYTQDVQNTYL